jgi:hypothetical protein
VHTVTCVTCRGLLLFNTTRERARDICRGRFTGLDLQHDFQSRAQPKLGTHRVTTLSGLGYFFQLPAMKRL